MKHIFNTYGYQLVLLDATYKTTKYALPLFFLVVKTNVNFQVCAVFVIQEESTDMILKALNTVKKWNPKVTPKYAFVDFDEREITALESVYPNVKVFLCDFHREQAWNRWVNKADNGVANVADQIKVYLRSIAHSTTHDDAQLTVRNLMNSDFFNGKVKNWFTKIWLPNIRRWCLAYRPDDLILCNTNNGTERLNEDLKYDDLDGYKNCSLSELLTVIIESFIPKHYSKYVSLNIRYGDGCKKYAPGVPEFLRNRPKQVVDVLLDKMYRVTDDIVVRSLGNQTFIVESFEEGTRIRKEYRTYLGNSDQFCSCTCYNFRRYRMLCKHFFAIFQSGKATFYDLTGLFLDHPYMILDRNILTGDFGISLNKIREEKDDNEIFRCNSESDSLDVSCESDQDTFRELPLKQSLLKRKKINIRAQLKQIKDLTYTTNNLEIIQELDTKVQSLLVILRQKYVRVT